jgi:hypothetical protein
MNGTRGLVIAIVATFVVGLSVGLVSGILLMRFAGPHGPRFARMPAGGTEMRMDREDGPGGPEGRGRRMGAPGRSRTILPFLERALDLTPPQREQIREVLDRARAEHEAERESTRVAIQRLLTEKQRAQWRALEERYQETWRGRRGRRAPDDPER